MRLFFTGKPLWSFDELCERAADGETDVVITDAGFGTVREAVARLDAAGIPYRHFAEDPKRVPKSNQACFDAIYKNYIWGGRHGFYSGGGSHDKRIIGPYIDLVTRLILDNGLHRVVEVGCGDFNVSRQILGNLQSQGFSYDYRGMDIVEDLITYNSKQFGTDAIHFSCGDASAPQEKLPDGDLLIIRQVLQHLSNADIAQILEKTKKFHFLLITEHIYEGEDVRYNLDKKTGNHTRLNACSGVYIEQAPFGMQHVVHLLRIPDSGGVIRTSLVIS